MNPTDWTQSPLAVAAGWAILHSLWQGLFIAAALAGVFAVTRSAGIRYNAACTSLLILLLAFFWTLIGAIPDAGTTKALSSLPLPAWKSIAPGEFRGIRGEVRDLVPRLAYLWAAGVFLVSLRNAAGWISVRQLRVRGTCSPPLRWQQQFAKLTAELRVSRPVQLLESCLVDAPMVLGHLRPLVLMPVGLLTAMPVEQVEAVLIHELAHIRRWDYFANLCQRVVESLLFYHPAVWWISARIRAEREHCCDDTVVALRGNAKEYAHALASLAENRWSGREPAVAVTGGSLVNRIRRLLDPKGSTSLSAPLIAVGVLMIGTAAAAMAWPQNEATSSSPYEKWLNEDVVYIIADAERAAFQKLQTNEERDMFIQQFWARLDPKPETPANEFKDEHYRRIAYATERFRTASGRSGWRTDRGHVYIIYGPPDEIESHPEGRGDDPPYEAWAYRRVDRNLAIIYFSDRNRTGDYRIAPGSFK
jgi:GWxTD domain-containing protein